MYGQGVSGGPNEGPPQVTPSSQTLIRYTTPAPVGPTTSFLKMPAMPPQTLLNAAMPTPQLTGPSYVTPPGPLHSTR